VISNIPLKWFKKPQPGHWIYTLDRFAADRGAAQLTLTLQAWNDYENQFRQPRTHDASIFTGFGRVGYMYETDVPQWIRDRMAVLNIAEEGTLIERVGVRWNEPPKSEIVSYNKNGTYTRRIINAGRENRWYVLDVLET